MTNQLTIRLNNKQEFKNFWEITEKYFNPLCNLNISVLLRQNSQGYDLQFKLLQLNEINKNFTNLVAIISSITASYLFNFYLKEIILKKYENKKAILAMGFQPTCNDQTIIAAGLTELKELIRLENPSYFQNLAQGIGNFFAKENLLHLQGFYNFRLKNLNNLADRAMDKTICQILEQTDYQALIKTLQNFVCKQKTVIPTVHILLYEDGSFQLHDHQGVIIKKQEIIAEEKVIKNYGLGYDESLAGAIINLAPKKIVVHKKNEQTPISPILKDILGDKLMLCNGCNLCLQP